MQDAKKLMIKDASHRHFGPEVDALKEENSLEATRVLTRSASVLLAFVGQERIMQVRGQVGSLAIDFIYPIHEENGNSGAKFTLAESPRRHGIFKGRPPEQKAFVLPEVRRVVEHTFAAAAAGTIQRPYSTQGSCFIGALRLLELLDNFQGPLLSYLTRFRPSWTVVLPQGRVFTPSSSYPENVRVFTPARFALPPHDAAGSSGVGTLLAEALSNFALRQPSVINRPVVDEFRVRFQPEHNAHLCHKKWLAAHRSFAVGGHDLVIFERFPHPRFPLAVIDALWFRTGLIQRFLLRDSVKKKLSCEGGKVEFVHGGGGEDGDGGGGGGKDGGDGHDDHG